MKSLRKIKNHLAVYQGKSGAIEIRTDTKKQTLWANIQQMADLFDTDKSGTSSYCKEFSMKERHKSISPDLKNIAISFL